MLTSETGIPNLSHRQPGKTSWEKANSFRVIAIRGHRVHTKLIVVYPLPYSDKKRISFHSFVGGRRLHLSLIWKTIPNADLGSGRFKF